MSLGIRVVSTLKLRLKSIRHLRHVCVDKHTFSADTDEFKKNNHVDNESNIKESLKIAPLNHQSAIETIKTLELESEVLKVNISVQDANIKIINRIIKTQDVIIRCKDDILNNVNIKFSFLEAELLSIKQTLHFRGVINRFEFYNYSRGLSVSVGQPKMTRSATWVKILKDDYDLQKSLSELKGFPSSVPSADVPAVIAKLVTEFYQRLSNDIDKDLSAGTMCIINEHFCSDWEMGFMVTICESIPVRYTVVK